MRNFAIRRTFALYLGALSILLTIFFSDQSIKIKGQEASRPELIIQNGHSLQVSSVVYSSSGKLIASGSEDYTIKLWDTQTGFLIKTFVGHSSSISSLAFSPDESLIVSGSNDGTVRLWDVKTGQFIRAFNGHTSQINSVAFSPNGKNIASGSGWYGQASDNTIRLWDIKSGQSIKVLKKHTARVTSIAFSPSGELLVSGSEDGTVNIWSVSSGRIRNTFDKEQSSNYRTTINFVDFSPEGQYIAVASEDSIKVKDLSGGTVRTIKSRDSYFNTVSLSSDWKYALTSGGYSDGIELWNLTTGQLIRSTGEVAEGTSAIAFSPDGKNYVTGSSYANVKQWETHNGTLIRSLENRSAPVSAVVFSPDKSILASASGNKIKLWDLKSGKIAANFEGHASNVNCIAFSPDSKFLISGSDEDSIRVWSVTEGYLRNIGSPNEIHAVAFSPKGQIIASGWSDNRGNIAVMLWDWKTGRLLRKLPVPATRVGSTVNKSLSTSLSHAPGEPNLILSIAFSHDGKNVAAGAIGNRSITIWNVQTGQMLRNLPGQDFAVTSVDFSPDGGTIVSAGTSINLWSVERGQLIKSIDKHSDYINAVKFSPDGKLIASASNDRTIKLWNVADGNEMRSFSEHASGVNSVAFSNDGNSLVSGGIDNTTRIWSVNSGKLLTTIMSFIDDNWIAYTPDNYYTSSKDGLKYVGWRVNNNFYSASKYKEQFNRPDMVINTSLGVVQPVVATSNPAETIPVKRNEALAISAAEKTLRERWKDVKYYALVIGNSKYDSTVLGSLRTPRKNAEDVAKLLEGTYGFTVETIYDGTRMQILNALDKYRYMTEINSNASLLIYYTGHGTYEDDTQVAYWQPKDAEPNKSGTWISADQVINHIRGIKARHILVVSDSCFAGGFLDPTLGGVPQFEEPVLYLIDSMEHPSRYMMVSTGKDYVEDVGEEGHSVFTHGFLVVLRNPRSNIFTAEQIWGRIREYVIHNSKAGQRPLFDAIPKASRSSSSSEPGKFVFMRKL